MNAIRSRTLYHITTNGTIARGRKCIEALGSSLIDKHDRDFSSKLETKKLKITSKPPPDGTSDCIGPPDPASNIRPIRLYIPSEETPTETKFRQQRTKVQEWNHKFWTEHNTKFFQEKEEFVQSHKSGNGEGQKKTLSQEEISKFYKKFLDENRKAHLHYNKEWYKKNISLLWPAFKVSLIRLKRRLIQKSR